MDIQAEKLYHVYNQGNNRNRIFRERSDYLLFLKIVRQKIFSKCSIINYCLMPNHYHFLIDATVQSAEKIKLGAIEIGALSNGFRLLNSAYSTCYNKKYNQSGSVFRQKTKGKLIEQQSNKQDYPFICFQYIHQNPLKAKLVSKMEDWEFSSFRDYANLRDGTLVDKQKAYDLIDIDADNFYQQSYQIISEEMSRNIFE